MADTELLPSRAPRRTLEAPPVGGRPFEGETPRAFTARMRRQRRERREAQERADLPHPAGCLCTACRMWDAFVWHRDFAPRSVRRRDPLAWSPFDSRTWGASTGGGTT